MSFSLSNCFRAASAAAWFLSVSAAHPLLGSIHHVTSPESSTAIICVANFVVGNAVLGKSKLPLERHGRFLKAQTINLLFASHMPIRVCNFFF
jgi:hypothetical protein